MAHDIDFRSLAYYWLAAPIIIAVACGAIAYLLARRRLTQSFLIFLARFLVVFAVLLFLEGITLVLLPSVQTALRDSLAWVVGRTLALVGMSSIVSGSVILMQNPYLSFDVTAACLGGELFCTYIALVLAETRVSNRQRLVAIVIGLAVLLAFNLFRISFSIYIERKTGFRAHDLFYVFNMIFVLIIWAGWLWARRSGAPRPDESAA